MVLSLEETHDLFSKGHGLAPELIYAKGDPDTSSLDFSSYNKR
jgi:hypothetical protein